MTLPHKGDMWKREYSAQGIDLDVTLGIFHYLSLEEGNMFSSPRTKYANSPRNVLKSLGRFQVSPSYNTY
jgi:hypothetical protein